MTSSTLADVLSRAVAFHKAGQYTQAEAWYRAALAIDPDSGRTHSLLGLALVHAGRREEGAPYLKRAIELEPNQAAFRFNLIHALRVTGAPERALAELGALLSFEPDNVHAWERAGDVAMQQEDVDGAVMAWERAQRLNSQALSPVLKLARLEIGRGRLEAAIAILEPVAVRAAEYDAIYALWCQALTGLCDWPALRDTSRSWCDQFPKEPDAWRNRARAAFELDDYNEAADAFRRLLALIPPAARDLANYGVISRQALEFDTADAAFRQALTLEPGNLTALAGLARICVYRGRFPDAAELARAMLRIDRGYLPALSIVSELGSGRLDEAQLEVVSRLAVDSGIAPERRITAGFLYSRALDTLDDVDRAFAALERTHALALERDATQGRRYDPPREDARGRRLAALSRGPALPADRAGPRPIFIVGMPRSGTTLVEAVLGAHSRVLACGERPTLRRVLGSLQALDATGVVPDDRTLAPWARLYLGSLPALGGADYVTDKHPLNLDSVGLVFRLFPAAIVLHVRRDPVETGLSVYRHEFERGWTFAHSLGDIAHYHRRGELLAAHWAAAFPGRFHTVQYEGLVDEFATAVPALVAACGLAWEPQCLEFQRSAHAIATLSAVAIRGPVANGNRRAARYARHLAPLIEALAAAK